MNDKDVKEILNKDLNNLQAPKDEWSQIEARMKADTGKLKVKPAILAFCMAVVTVITIFQLQHINQQKEEDIQIANFLMESGSYLDDEDDYYF